MIAPPGYQHTPSLVQRCRRIGDVLEQPHHPDVVERPVLERERERIGLTQGRRDPGPLEVRAGEVELLALDVDAERRTPGILLPEHRQHRADAAADLEQARSGRELGPVAISR